MAHKQLSKQEEEYLRKFIGPPLQWSDYVLIAINRGHFAMNFCILNKDISLFPHDTIVLVPGFGSGYTGIALLGAELTKLGYEVAMPSLLGYGNSENPPASQRSDFLYEAANLHVWACKVLPHKRLHLVGHSMGAAINIGLAKMNKNVASLTLLDPVGLHKRGMLELAVKFAANGLGHAVARAFTEDPQWEIIKQYLPKQKSPFSRDRIKQRISEWRRLCKDDTLKALNEVIYEIPVRCIYGEKDTVSPCTIDCDGMHYVELPGLWHNTTMYGSKDTAKAIASFVFSNIK